MTFLNDDVRRHVQEALAGLETPVRLVVFTRPEDAAPACDFCAELKTLIEEVAELSDKVSVEIHDFIAEPEAARAYGVDKVPALAVVRAQPQARDYGLRLYGVPSGYEFSTLIEDIRLVSRGSSGLSAQTLRALARLTQPVHIQVYVTPTCPHCPRAVLLAHKLALASDLITADMVEAQEFPRLADHYRVFGVPRTVINEVIHIEGAVPEAALIAELMKVTDAEVMHQLQTDWEGRFSRS